MTIFLLIIALLCFYAGILLLRIQLRAPSRSQLRILQQSRAFTKEYVVRDDDGRIRTVRKVPSGVFTMYTG